jgi:hypothetical protein
MLLVEAAAKTAAFSSSSGSLPVLQAAVGGV